MPISLPPNPNLEQLRKRSKSESTMSNRMGKKVIVTLFCGLLFFCLNANAIGVGGDIDGDEDVDIGDAILSLQVLVGMYPQGVEGQADANNDAKIGLEESILVLRIVSGLGCSGYTDMIPVFTVSDTGQQGCYDEKGSPITCPSTGDSLYGQDAQYATVSPSFEVCGDSVVVDKNTNLMWQKAHNERANPNVA